MILSKRLVQYFGKSLKDLESEWGLSNGYINKVSTGKIKNQLKIRQILQSKGLNPDIFFNPELDFELKKSNSNYSPATPAICVYRGRGLRELKETLTGKLVPFLDQMVSAGPGAELLEYEDSCGLICLPEGEARGDLRALRVRGDSMEPTLRPGDIVVCDLGGWRGDGLYVLRDNESAYVKRVRRVREGLEVMSDNPAYASWSCPLEELVVVGRVCYSVIRL